MVHDLHRNPYVKNLSHDIAAVFKESYLARYRDSEMTVDGILMADEVVHDKQINREKSLRL